MKLLMNIYTSVADVISFLQVSIWLKLFANNRFLSGTDENNFL